jgi:hypothetical protein
MRHLQSALAAAVLALSAPALAWGATETNSQAGQSPAGTDAANPPAAAAPAVDPKHDPNKVICHTITPTGSRLGGERVCQPRHVWEEQSRNAKDMVDHNVSASLQRSPPGN